MLFSSTLSSCVKAIPGTKKARHHGRANVQRDPYPFSAKCIKSGLGQVSWLLDAEPPLAVFGACRTSYSGGTAPDLHRLPL